MNRAFRAVRIVIACAAAACLLVASLAPQVATAQGLPITAEVDRTDIDLNETFTLTVTVYDQNNLPLPILPLIDGVQMTGRNFNDYQYIYNNGLFSAQATFKYTFQPTRTGKIEIGPISVTVDNYIYSTNPITVTVAGSQGSVTLPSIPGYVSPPRVTGLMGQNFHAEAQVDNDQPFVGEQVTHTFRFFATDGRRRPVFHGPDFVGFWKGGELTPNKSAATESGRRYLVTEIDTVLFPILAGENVIEPGRMSLPGGLFGTDRAEFPSETIELSVRPLPGNEPDSFTGAVGKYEISARVSRNRTVVGEPVELIVFVEGEGNFENLPDPVWSTPVDWRAFSNESSVSTSILEGRAVGQKTYRRLLMPDAPGIYQLPPVKYSYFDPDLERYLTVSTDPIQIEVLANSSPVSDGADSLVDIPDGTADIRHIKPLYGGLSGPDGGLASTRVFWGIVLTPALALLVALSYRTGRRRLAAISASSTPAAARQTALAALSSLSPGASAADAAVITLHGYLSAALDRDTLKLDRDEIRTILTERGASGATLAQLEVTLAKLDEIRFAPSTSGDGEPAGEIVARLVRELGEEFDQ